MVDDHESDVSMDDGAAYQGAVAELWDTFWEAKPDPYAGKSPYRAAAAASGRQPRHTPPMYAAIQRPRNPFSEKRPESRGRPSVQAEPVSFYDSVESLDVVSWPLPSAPAAPFQEQRTDQFPARQASLTRLSERNYQLYPLARLPLEPPVILPRTSSLSRTSRRSRSAQPLRPHPPVSVDTVLTQDVIPTTANALPRSEPALVRDQSTTPAAPVAAPTEPTRAAPPAPISTPPQESPAASEELPILAPIPRRSSRRPPPAAIFRQPSPSARPSTSAGERTSYHAKAQRRASRSQSYLPISATEDILSHYQDSPPLLPTQCADQEQPESLALDQSPKTSVPEPEQYYHPQPRPLPAKFAQPTSVFELDSDHESILSGDESYSFARRLVRGLTISGHKHSASESRRRAKLARAQAQKAAAAAAATTTAQYGHSHSYNGSKSNSSSSISSAVLDVTSAPAESTPSSSSNSAVSSPSLGSSSNDSAITATTTTTTTTYANGMSASSSSSPTLAGAAFDGAQLSPEPLPSPAATGSKAPISGGAPRPRLRRQGSSDLLGLLLGRRNRS